MASTQELLDAEILGEAQEVTVGVKDEKISLSSVLIVLTVPALFNRLAQFIPRLQQGTRQCRGVWAFDRQVHAATKRPLQWSNTPRRFAVPILLKHDLAGTKGQDGKPVFFTLVFNFEAQHLAVKA